MPQPSHAELQKQATERANRAIYRKTNTNSGSMLPTMGILLIVVGALIALYFLFIYDTSITTEPRYVAGYGTISGERVHNQGLMQNRLLGSVGGMFVAFLGSGMFFVGKRNA